jgi:hypothetical protein
MNYYKKKFLWVLVKDKDIIRYIFETNIECCFDYFGTRIEKRVDFFLSPNDQSCYNRLLLMIIFYNKWVLKRYYV